jgi:hypothetical protein
VMRRTRYGGGARPRWIHQGGILTQVEALGKAEGSGEEAPLAGAGEGAPSSLLPCIRIRRHVYHVVAVVCSATVQQQ